MQIFLNIIFSYLLGSISGSMVLGKIKGIDIREMGSGNAGGTNAFRTVGPLFAIGVVIIDILKGYVAVQCISGFDFWNIYDSNNIPLMKITCGVGAVLGHVYPIYYSFKGVFSERMDNYITFNWVCRFRNNDCRGSIINYILYIC